MGLLWSNSFLIWIVLFSGFVVDNDVYGSIGESLSPLKVKISPDCSTFSLTTKVVAPEESDIPEWFLIDDGMTSVDLQVASIGVTPVMSDEFNGTRLDSSISLDFFEFNVSQNPAMFPKYVFPQFNSTLEGPYDSTTCGYTFQVRTMFNNKDMQIGCLTCQAMDGVTCLGEEQCLCGSSLRKTCPDGTTTIDGYCGRDGNGVFDSECPEEPDEDCADY